MMADMLRQREMSYGARCGKCATSSEVNTWKKHVVANPSRAAGLFAVFSRFSCQFDASSKQELSLLLFFCISRISMDIYGTVP